MPRASSSLHLGSGTASILDLQIKESGDGKRLMVLTQSSLKFATPP